MTETQADFQIRVHEIHTYFDFLCTLDEDDCTLVYVDLKEGPVQKRIDNTTLRILKANCFLLLYNMIESTTRHIITAITNHITSKKTPYTRYTDDIKLIWIKKKIKGKGEIHDIVKEMVEHVAKNKIIELCDDCVNLSGNVDARKIKEIIRKFGINVESSSKGEKLLEIKNKRNSLAHGERSFSDMGMSLSTKDIQDYINQSVSYMQETMNQVESYLRGEGYYENPQQKSLPEKRVSSSV